MKTIMAVFLLLVSTSLLAERPECSFTPGACAGGVPSGRAAAVPEPGTLALIGLGAAGLVVARRRKK
jgi:hypothetical protein